MYIRFTHHNLCMKHLKDQDRNEKLIRRYCASRSLVAFRLPAPADKLLSFCRCFASVRRPRKSAAPSGYRFWSRTDDTSNQIPRRQPYQWEILVFSRIISGCHDTKQSLQRTRLRLRIADSLARISLVTASRVISGIL